MLRAISIYLRDLIAARDYAEVVGGLVQAQERKVKAGKRELVQRIPVDCMVTGADCEDEFFTALVPNSEVGSIIFFEVVQAPEIVRVRGSWKFYVAQIRLVGWANLDKLGITKASNCDGCTVGSKIMADVEGLLPKSHTISGDCSISNLQIEKIREETTNPFSKYSLDEKTRPYTMLPYEVFSMVLRCEWTVNPDCVASVTVGDAFGCNGPSPVRKKYPNQFTCDQLNDADNGLTDEQLECLDCQGGDCEGVEIIDQDSNVLETVADGGQYQVIVLSGIDGGASDTTYSNSIIAT